MDGCATDTTVLFLLHITHISSVLVTVQSCGGETLPHEQVQQYQLSLEHQAPEHLKLDMLVTDRVIQSGYTSH